MLPYEIQYDWAEYKKDTEYVAGFLLQKSTKCGYRRHVKIENLKGHIIHHSAFKSCRTGVRPTGMRTGEFELYGQVILLGTEAEI